MDEELIRYRAGQAHEYLERIRQAGEDCAALRAQVDDAYERAGGMSGIDYTMPIVAASPNSDAIPDAVARIIDLIQDYTADLSAFEDMRHAASKAMMAMPSQTEARVLRMRYLLGMPWERVCTDMGYSWDGMMSLRRRALASYYEVMPSHERDPRHSAI